MVLFQNSFFNNSIINDYRKINNSDEKSYTIPSVDEGIDAFCPLRIVLPAKTQHTHGEYKFITVYNRQPL